MDKTYRLKKVYPGLPSDWEVDMVVGLGDYGNSYSPCSAKYSNTIRISPQQVENYSEYWEEIKPVERDFEILEFIRDGRDEVFTKGKTGFWCRFAECPEEVLLRNTNYKISKVERLSGQEVFKIGDKAQSTGSTNPHKIESFKIMQKQIARDRATGRWINDGVDRMWVTWDKNGGGNWLDNIELVREPILVTEDGVKIFEGDEYFSVDSETFRIGVKFIANKPSNEFYNKFFNSLYYYSTKEAAEEYIRLNKPQYSLEEVYQAVQQWAMSPTSSKNIEKFLKKVKEESK